MNFLAAAAHHILEELEPLLDPSVKVAIPAADGRALTYSGDGWYGDTVLYEDSLVTFVQPPAGKAVVRVTPWSDLPGSIVALAEILNAANRPEARENQEFLALHGVGELTKLPA